MTTCIVLHSLQHTFFKYIKSFEPQVKTCCTDWEIKPRKVT